MAMPRSRGGRWSTRRPPIHTSPWLGVSRPATILRSVVLPQPDAPSSTRNSWSAIVRSTEWRAVKLPKCLATFLIEISAIFVSPGRSAVGDAPHGEQIFPHREDEDQRRQHEGR